MSRRATGLVLPLAAAATLACGSSSYAAPRLAKPPDAQWQYQLQGTVDRSNPAKVFDVDGVTTPASTVRALKASGRYTVCYFSAGTYESFRSDRRRLPRRTLGKTLDGFPDERWLDIRRIDEIAPVIRSRMRSCRSKGFQAVEPDNVDGFENDTGFALKRADALRFTRWLARTAHRLGLAVGLKNSADLAAGLAPRFDFAVVEQCFQYDECERYTPFVRRRKPVYVVEYERAPQSFCSPAKALGLNAIRKDVDLTAPSTPCPPG